MAATRSTSDSGAGALNGLRVLEISSGLSAPFAARILADLGADVVKVESSQGDSTRRWGPVLRGSPGAPRTALFEHLNWNKRAVCLSPGDDQLELHRLLGAARIAIIGDDLGLLDHWRLELDALRERYPDTVFATVSAFGGSGPYRHWRGSDLVVQAMGGLMAISGVTDREPLKRGLRQTAYTTGLTVAYAALAAVYEPPSSSPRAHIDVAAVETVAAELILNAPTYAFMGAVQSRRPGSKDPFTGEPIAAKDGYAAVQTNAWTTLAMFAELLDEPRLAEERFDNQAKRIANAQDLTQIVTDALGRVTGRELLERASAAGMLAGFAQTAAQLLDCPQLVERGAFVELEADAGALGPWRMPVLLSRMSRTPATVRHRAPALGEHNGRVWLDEGPPRASSPAPASPRTSPSRPARPAGRPGPLAGLRVVDLSSVVAAPLVGGMLCDLGADVIKVEAPARLDQGRGPVFGPLFNNEPGDEPWNRSGSFQSLNRGKRSISLDLKHERGREILRQLIASADILLENFTPRVMRGWGLTYESLAAQNPGLIMFSNTGYGSTGPWSSFKAQGTSLEVTMGVGTYSGYPGEKPTKIGQSYPDFIAAWAGLTAVMAALVSRRETGLGQWIDCGMYELGTAMIPEAFIAVQAGRPDYERRGNEDLGGLFSGVFRAAGEDRWVAVSIPDEKTWAALRAVVPGLPDTPPGDSDRDAAAAALRQWLAPRDALAAATRLQGCGVPAAPVNNARDLLFDPHLFARGMYEDCDYGDDVGVVPILSRGFRWNASRAHVGVRGPGPRFAAHNDEVLGELGVAPGERERLRREGILVDRPIKLPVLAPADVAANLRNHIYSEVDHDYRQRIRTGRARLVVEPTDRVD